MKKILIILSLIIPSLIFCSNNVTKQEILDSELIAAASSEHDDWITVNFLLTQGASVNAKDKDDNTALHHATGNTLPEVVSILIAHGAYVNATNKNDATPLHWADSPIISKILIDNGASVNAKDNFDQTPLHWASAHGYPPEGIKLLLNKGTDVNAKEKNRGATALFFAVSNINENLVKLLIKYGVDINATSGEGVTVFYLVDPRRIQFNSKVKTPEDKITASNINNLLNTWAPISRDFYTDKSCSLVDFKTKLKSNPNLNTYVKCVLEIIKRCLLEDLAKLIVYDFFIDEVSFGDWIKVCKEDKIIEDFGKLIPEEKQEEKQKS